MKLELIKYKTSSLDLAEFLNRSHKETMKNIRSVENAWILEDGEKFSLSSYKNSQGKVQPMYSLTKSQLLFIASKFNDRLRAAIIRRLDFLEQENLRLAHEQRDFARNAYKGLHEKMNGNNYEYIDGVRVYNDEM